MYMKYYYIYTHAYDKYKCLYILNNRLLLHAFPIYPELQKHVVEPNDLRQRPCIQELLSQTPFSKLS